MTGYVKQIEEALGIAQPMKTRVHFMPLDMGRKIAVMATLPSYKRITTAVPFQDGWQHVAIEGLREKMEEERGNAHTDR